MKSIIQNLKNLTGHRADWTFAKSLGLSKATIARIKAGDRSKADKMLLRLEYLLSRCSVQELQKYLKTFQT